MPKSPVFIGLLAIKRQFYSEFKKYRHEITKITPKRVEGFAQ